MLLTWHNLTYYQRLMQKMRAAIIGGTFDATARKMRDDWGRGDWSIGEWPQPHLSPVP